MSRITRREFLISIVAGLGAITLDQILTGCSQAGPVATPTEPVQPTSTKVVALPTEARPTVSPAPIAEEAPAVEPSPTTAGAPDLVVARAGEPEELVRRALLALGGMDQFVSSDARVIIKPNICVGYHTYEYAATTNPWVVGALVKLCFEAGAASVQVLDYPFGGTIEQAYAKSGIEEQVKANGGAMAYMPGFKYTSVDIPQGQDLKSLFIFDEILKADLVINVPIAKHHNLAGLTMGMKNLMGIIRDRQMMHRTLASAWPTWPAWCALA